MGYLFTEFVNKLETHILPLVEYLSSFGVVKNSRHIAAEVGLGY